MRYYFDWQANQAGCDCEFHRYHIAHICECGALYPHIQADCDTHRAHDCIGVDPTFIKHGDTASAVFDRLMLLGLLPYGEAAYGKVYDKMAEIQEEATRLQAKEK